MNINTLKKFAQETRIRLLAAVADKLNYVLNADSAGLRDYGASIKTLKEEIQKSGEEVVIDKVAYTWFNRLMALRFMDVNDYQPLRLKIISPKPGFTQPEILDEAAQGNIPEALQIDRQKINDLLDGKMTTANPQNEVYRLLLIASCNHLQGLFPFLFEKIKDYTELLLPDDLISELSIIQDFVKGMTAEDCQETEMIGWLYQFYISEKKDEVFAKKGKVKKEEIPAATQLFTPRWIVEYMVQNTVGKLWLQNHPESDLKKKMPYYMASAAAKTEGFIKIDSPEELTLLDQACGSGHILVYGFELMYQIYEEAGYTASQIPALIIEKNLYGYEIDERAAQLASFSVLMKARSTYRRLFRKPLQPNILCYRDLNLSEETIENAFEGTAPELSENLKYDFQTMQQATNLGSLIQPRSATAELEKIALLAKENENSGDVFLQYQWKELNQAVAQLLRLKKKFCCIVDNPPYMGGGAMNKALSKFVKANYPDSKSDLMACFMESGLAGLQENGFLGMINQHSWLFLSSYEKLRAQLIEETQFDTLLHLGPRTFPEIGGEVVQNAAFTFINAKPQEKGSYIRLVDYKDSALKSERTLAAIQNPDCDWFYTADQKDFEKIPGNQIGYWLNAITIEIFNNKENNNYLIARHGLLTGNDKRFLRKWYESKFFNIGLNSIKYEDIKISKRRFYPMNKGGAKRKWYGNLEYIIDLKGFENNFNNNKIKESNLFFKEGITWSEINTGGIATRYSQRGILFGHKGPTAFFKNYEKLEYFLGFSNSKPFNIYKSVINSTLSFTSGNMEKIPVVYNNKYNLSKSIKQSIKVSRQEWNSRETAWDFKENELVRLSVESGEGRVVSGEKRVARNENSSLATKNSPLKTIKEAIDLYKHYWSNKFQELHQNEEELNARFIEVYGLQEELTPDVPLTEITILKDELDQKKLKDISENYLSGWELNSSQWQVVSRQSFPELPFNHKELIKQFISYAVGLIFGRYSLDKEGLILANQGETVSDYVRKVDGGRWMVDGEEAHTDQPPTTNHQPPKSHQPPKNKKHFLPDSDAVIPVLENEWFTDDIVTQFREIVKAVWGEADLQRNMDFIEKTLGKSIRQYFYKDFYNDHLKRYKKRPIYWLFASPGGSFQALIYLHRYHSNTLNLMVNNYLRPYIDKLENQVAHLRHVAIEGSDREKTQAKKEIVKVEKMIVEIRKYDKEVLHPLALEQMDIDLDDGVLVNYNKFGAAVKTVSGLNDAKKKAKVKQFDWIDGGEIR